MKRTLIAGAAATLLLAAAPAAQAAHDPLAGGTTTLKLDAAVAKALTGAGVRVSPVAPARGGVNFPITGGTLDSGNPRGTIEHSGGLRFAAGGKSLTARNFVVKLGKRSTLSGRVGNSRVTLLTLDLSRAKVSRRPAWTPASPACGSRSPARPPRRSTPPSRPICSPAGSGSARSRCGPSRAASG